MRGATLFVEIVILLVMLRVEPSTAQETVDRGCWDRITSCLDVASHPTGCCTSFDKAIKNERECFCLMKESVITDRGVAAGMARILVLCGYTESFLTICSRTGSNSSSPSMPSTSNPPSKTTPTVPTTLSPLASPDFEDPPSAPTNSAPPKISSTSPPAAENGTSNCFTRISDCLEKGNFMECCTTLVYVIKYEKDCLCPQKHVFLGDPQFASAIATFLSTCKVPDSLDQICSATSTTGSPSLSPPPTIPMTLPPGASPDTSINSTSNTNGTTASASTSGSTNNFAYSGGLLPTLLLIIWVTLV